MAIRGLGPGGGWMQSPLLISLNRCHRQWRWIQLPPICTHSQKHRFSNTFWGHQWRGWFRPKGKVFKSGLDSFAHCCPHLNYEPSESMVVYNPHRVLRHFSYDHRAVRILNDASNFKRLGSRKPIHRLTKAWNPPQLIDDCRLSPRKRGMM